MKTRLHNNKEQIFCDWRRCWVRLTPEEWVRQQLLHRLVEQLGYPVSLIAVEAPIKVGEVQKRCDALVYKGDMQPLMLIECKAEYVALTQKTLDQAATYNRKLHVPYLLLHNGPQTIVCRVQNKHLEFADTIPTYNELLSTDLEV